MIVLIDHYDSFAHNLARHVELAGARCVVKRQDTVRPNDAILREAAALILSPGPCGPQEAAGSIDLVVKCGPHLPILGVCLGHQIIAEAYGGRTEQSRAPMHGRASLVRHKNAALFAHMPDPFAAGRYHSLQADLSAARDLDVIAETEQGEIMALQHRVHSVFGVQFHPESILTPHGLQIICNFLAISQTWRKDGRITA